MKTKAQLLEVMRRRQRCGWTACSAAIKYVENHVSNNALEIARSVARFRPEWLAWFLWRQLDRKGRELLYRRTDGCPGPDSVWDSVWDPGFWVYNNGPHNCAELLRCFEAWCRHEG